MPLPYYHFRPQNNPPSSSCNVDTAAELLVLPGPPVTANPIGPLLLTVEDMVEMAIGLSGNLGGGLTAPPVEKDLVVPLPGDSAPTAWAPELPTMALVTFLPPPFPFPWP